MGPPKSGRLFLKSHGDCFLHATAGWLSYASFKLTEDRLAIVRVTLPNGQAFCSTLCPTPISYQSVKRGVSRDKYLEIDPYFAKELGLENDAQVVVEAVSSVERCTNLLLTPHNPDDLDILIENQEKIEYELLDRIRVVSASLLFPIWIDKMVVPVRVVRSEPSASWVLLVQDGRICIEPSSASSPGTGSSVSSVSTPGRSSSQGSGESPNSDNQSSNSLISSSLSSTLTAPFSYLLNTTKSLLQNPPLQRVAVDSSAPERGASPRRTTTTPEPATISRPHTVHHFPPSSIEPNPAQGKHSRMRSWHAGTDYGKRDPPDSKDRAPQFLPPYSGMPKINACLRVQPHPLCGISSPQTPGGLWSHERIFDVFVHPSTLPEVYCYLRDLHKYKSFLVELRPIVSPHTYTAAAATRKQTAPSKDGGGYAWSDTQSEILDDGLDDSQTSSGMESLIDIAQLTGTPTAPPDASSASLPSPDFCRSLVARLCFATRIRCCSGGSGGGGQMVAEIDDVETDAKDHTEVEGEAPEGTETEVWVKPGHVLMSDPLRRQLRVGACSRVKLLQVKEEWRVPLVNKPSITVHLQPLDPQQGNPDLVTPFREWIARVAKASKYSAALVEGQVLPLLSEKDVWIYCRVGLKPRPLKSHTLSYCLIRPQDINNGFVKITSDHAHQKSAKSPPKLPPAIALPDIRDLDPPTISESLNNFGALDKLLADGLRYLKSVLADPRATGALLVCGQAGSGGIGCGKSSLARLLCKAVTQYPYCAHLTTVDCTSLRGQTMSKVKRRLRGVFVEAEWHQPSVVLLDDMDHATPHFLDAQEEAMGEGALSTRRAQVLLDIMSEHRRKAAQVVVIATAESRQNVHLELLQSKGEHAFENILEIAPPSLVDRRDILNAILSNKARVPDNELTERDIRTIALKTEGFQAGDIVALVDRAMSHFELRLICPPKPLERSLSTRYSGRRARISSNSGEYHPQLAPGNIHRTDSFESSPSPKKRGPVFDYLHSETPPTNRKTSNALSSASAATLVDEKAQGSIGDVVLGSLTSLGLILDDFLRGLKGFVPTSLRGLPLHSAGSIDFSSVGGLEQAKQTLRETLLWPSKYPKLFDQCPIKQRFGVLLYGAPGTGKTLLAGAVAKEFGLHFVSIKGPELLNKYIGASEQAVRDLFTRAQAAKPCILFFDEFDSLAPKRGHDRTGVTDRVVNQLLTQLDGVESLQGVYVLAATSRPDLIDPALLRPGRIDRSLFCDIPTQEERLAILEALSKGMPLENHANLQTIAKQTEAFTGADLKALLYNAQLQSAHEVLEWRAHSSREAKTETEGDGTPAEQKKNAGDNSVDRALVFAFTDTGLRRQKAPQLESKVALLYNTPMRRQSTLTIRGAHKAKQKLKATITHQHLLSALGDVRPSVTPAERKKFDKIYEKFQGKVKTALADVKEQRATMA